MQSPGIKYQPVEVKILAGDTQPTFNFDPQPFLVSKKIVSIETLTINDMTLSPIYGLPLPTKAQASTLYFSFYGADPDSPYNSAPVATMGQQPGQGLWLRQIPFWKMHSLNNLTDPFEYEPFEIEPRNLAWEQSQVITKAAGGLNPEANMAIVLIVGYMGIEQTQGQ